MLDHNHRQLLVPGHDIANCMLSFAKYEDISQIARTVRILAIPVRLNALHASSDVNCGDKRKGFI